MPKTLGPGLIYLIGSSDGPCKIGTTIQKLSRRLYKARSDLGNRKAEVLRTWHHERAFIVERFTHFYLQNLHLECECFDIGEQAAIAAVERTIAFVKAPMGEKTWLDRAGMSPIEAIDFFSVMPGQDTILTGDEAISRYWKRYWSDQYVTRHRRKRSPWVSEAASERHYSSHMGAE